MRMRCRGRIFSCDGSASQAGCAKSQNQTEMASMRAHVHVSACRTSTAAFLLQSLKTSQCFSASSEASTDDGPFDISKLPAHDKFLWIDEAARHAGACTRRL